MVGVALCQENQDVLLTTANARCIRFAVTEVRVFKGRDSTGVRGIRLQGGDTVISMAILNTVDATPAERSAYLKWESAKVAAEAGEAEPVEDSAPADDEDEGEGGDAQLTPERVAELEKAEQFVLTVTDTGLGKRTSSYDYRRTGRGGQGFGAHDLSRGGQLAASFPVENGDEIMLVTDAGQLIRVPVKRIRIASRRTKGVIIFRTGEGEKVVSVERIAESESDEAEAADAIETGETTVDEGGPGEA